MNNMKRGDIVKEKKTGKVGMIVYKKNNSEIGVNFCHYHILACTGLYKDEVLKEKVFAMGSDDLYSKEELEKI